MKPSEFIENNEDLEGDYTEYQLTDKQLEEIDKRFIDREEVLKELKKKRVVKSFDVKIKFKTKDNKTIKVPAIRGEEIVKWKDILQAFKSKFEKE